jgi:hypothetical protein
LGGICLYLRDCTSRRLERGIVLALGIRSMEYVAWVEGLR